MTYSLPTNPLASKPAWESLYTVSGRPTYIDKVVTRVREYYQERWPWVSPKAKEVYANQDLEAWTLLVCPHAPEERGELAVAWIVFFFFYDDLLETLETEEATRSVDGIKEIMAASKKPENTIEIIMEDLCTRILSVGDKHSRNLAHQLFDDTARYMEAVADQTERHKSLKQDLEGYLRYRVVDGGCWFLFRLFAWELDLIAPTELLSEDPEFQSLKYLSAAHEMLMNDMYSYRREAKLLHEDVDGAEPAQAYVLYNAVCILLQQEGIDEVNVMHYLGAEITKNEHVFFDVVKRLNQRYQDSKEDLEMINCWAVILTDFNAGSREWSSTCRRYNLV